MLFGGCEDPLVRRVIEAIRATPGISRSTLHRQTAKAMPAPRFLDVLSRAAATGEVEAERIETGGRPREVWRPRSGSRSIADVDMGEKGNKVENPAGGPLSTFSPFHPENATEVEIAQPTAGERGAPRPSSFSKHGRTL
jgi:hypothetical protein